jgi:hypothetical protein
MDLMLGVIALGDPFGDPGRDVAIPDQYGRRWADDDGDSPKPPNPGLTDLPPLQPWWGPQSRR